MQTAEQTRQAAAAREVRVMAHFDALDAEIRRIHDLMAADGLLRSPTERTRLGEGK